MEQEKTSPKLERDESGRLLPGQQSLNPNGRPTGTFSLVTLLKQKLQEVPEGRTKTYAEELISSMLHKGIIERDSKTHRLVMNYVDGMPKQSVDVTTGGEKIVGINIIAPETEPASEEPDGESNTTGDGENDSLQADAEAIPSMGETTG